MINVHLVYSDIKDKERLEEAEIESPFFVTYYDMLKKDEKSKGFKLKSEFGARLDPFIVLYEGDSPIKAYYSEDSKDVIFDLIKDLNKQV